MKRKYFLSCLIAVILLGVLAFWHFQSTAVPNALDLTGDSGGCGNFSVYRFNPARTMAFQVSVDEKKHPISENSNTISLEVGVPGVTVQVLQFRWPAGTYFCDDVGGDAKPFATWTATAGTLEIRRFTERTPTQAPNATHRVNLILKDATITNSVTGETLPFGNAQIEDAGVGWSPG